jgi:hypothetical protein
MTGPIELRPHGLHSEDYTKQVGTAFSESVRVLNYASSGQYRDVAMPYPSIVYELLGSLLSGTGGLPQLLEQLGQQLTALLEADRLDVRHGPHTGDPNLAVLVVGNHLADAARLAGGLAEALQRAQQVAGAIGMPTHLVDDEEDR